MLVSAGRVSGGNKAVAFFPEQLKQSALTQHVASKEDLVPSTLLLRKEQTHFRRVDPRLLCIAAFAQLSGIIRVPPVRTLWKCKGAHRGNCAS